MLFVVVSVGVVMPLLVVAVVANDREKSAALAAKASMSKRYNSSNC